MGNIICSEFIKLKKSFIIPLVLIGGIFLPAMYFGSDLNMDYDTIRRSTSAIDILSNINIMQIQFLNTVLFSLIGGYIFSREYSDKTADVLYSYSISRMKIFIGKAIVVFTLIILVYILNVSSSLITIGLSLGLDEVKNIVSLEFKTCLISALLQLLIIPIPMLIGMISKNIIIPVIYGVIGSVTSMFMMMTDVWMQLSPFMIPALPFYHFFRGDPIDYIAVTLSGGTVFLGSIAVIIFYLRNCDIN